MLSNEFYTLCAGSYVEYATRRTHYLSAVDELICSEKNLKLSNLIDVGSGDGQRGYAIARRLGIQDVTFLDNSEGMLKLLRRINGIKVKKGNIAARDLDVYKTASLILCLWNVLGHVQTLASRNQAMANLYKILEPGGVLFLDVNNRYNILQYGMVNVIKNVIKDLLFGSSGQGDYSLVFTISSQKVSTRVHIFNPFEIEKLIKSAGLVIEKRWLLNYKTGAQENSIWRGQLLYKVRR